MSKRDFEDDGRTIADMSGLERQNLFFPKPRRRRPPAAAPAPQQREPEEDSGGGPVPWQSSLTPEERRISIMAAIHASLLVAFVYIIGLGAVILLLLWLWAR